jgi:hypothetical protein
MGDRIYTARSAAPAHGSDRGPGEGRASGFVSRSAPSRGEPRPGRERRPPGCMDKEGKRAGPNGICGYAHAVAVSEGQRYAANGRQQTVTKKRRSWGG